MWASFDTIFESKICGSNIVDYFTEVGSSLCTFFDADDFQSSFIGCGQLFQRAFAAEAQRYRLHKTKKSLYVMIANNPKSIQDKVASQKLISDSFHKWWLQSADGQVSFCGNKLNVNISFCRCSGRRA